MPVAETGMLHGTAITTFRPVSKCAESKSLVQVFSRPCWPVASLYSKSNAPWPIFGTAQSCALWSALIAPATAIASSDVVRRSVFTTKVSLIAIVCLAIASQIEFRHAPPIDVQKLIGTGSPILLWATPALLLIESSTRAMTLSRSDVRWIGLLGVVAPVVIAVTFGVLTVSGTHAIAGGGKSFEYLRFPAQHLKTSGWARMAFCFLRCWALAVGAPQLRWTV